MNVSDKPISELTDNDMLLHIQDQNKKIRGLKRDLLSVKLTCAALFLYLFGYLTQAYADTPDRISLMLKSHHTGSQHFPNEDTLGLALTWEQENRIDHTVMAYRNSFDKLSVGYNIGYRLVDQPDFTVTPFVGVVTYHSEAKSFAVPSVAGVVPMVGLRVRKGKLWGSVVPMENGNAVFTAGITTEF